ncbi:SubName: Full=Related to GDP-fucose transporter {ECO:0000313/EMBL:CCA69630.1} [Serendipita indica DSM 11827]|nr:SubName: Full=Related to GDP-fucose transporter {ECO:0000313/EMBL:CCA69630.1} [Serendipita indica DSM 11827]
MARRLYLVSVRATATVLFYMFAAICMIIVNKWVLLKSTTPLFFLLAQLLIAVVLFLITHALGLFKISVFLQWDVCVGLWPMILANVIGLSANNYCLKYVDASFYQIARGLVLPLTVVLSLIFLKASRPSIRVLAACAVVTAGFFVGVLLDGSPSSDSKKANSNMILGVAFGLLSSVTTAGHAIIIKRSLPVVNNDAIELAWYSNVLSSALLIPVMLIVGEGADILDLVSSPLYVDGRMSGLGHFLWGSMVTGLVGWLLSIAGVLSIKITSPITHMVSSAVRGILQSAMGVWVFGDIITTGRGTSIFVILAGSAYYTWAKNEELLEQRAREANAAKSFEVTPIMFDADRRPSNDIESGAEDVPDSGRWHRRSRSHGNGYNSVPLDEIRTPDLTTEERKLDDPRGKYAD